MIDYEKVLAAKEQEILRLKTECASLKDKLILFPGETDVIYSMKDIIAMFPGNIFWRDRNGNVLGVNSTLAVFHGFNSPQEFILADELDVYPKDVLEALVIVDQEVKSSGEDFLGMEIGYDYNNEKHYFLSHKKAVRDDAGEVVGLVGISLDITEQKKLEKDLQIAKEKAEASNQSKSQFLAVMSHELRTPLACIINLIDLLKEKGISKSERDTLVSTIENCSKYLLTLVNDVLDFSKLETGKHHAKHKPVKLDELFRDIFNMLITVAKAKGLDLRIDCPENLPHVILSDTQVLRQILINLINNALKFTESGSVALHVRLLDRVENEVRLAFSVVDTGIGIPQNKLQEIFEPFQQLDDAYMRQSSRAGTGLGLAIVERLVKALGCHLEVHSELGKGSVFTLVGSFMLPSATDHPPRVTKKKSSRKKTPQPTWTRPPHILLIEDDAVLQFVHLKMLTTLGCTVQVASNGREALEKINNHDLVFADISLPDMSGFAVIKAIREREAGVCDVPIVALTVYTDKEEKNACLQAGANHFASKPVSSELLLDILQKYLPGFRGQK